MTGVVLRLLGMGRAIGRLFGWLTERPERLIAAVTLASFAILLAVLNHRTAQLAEARADLDRVRATYAQTIENYDRAAKEARRRQDESNLRVAHEQDAVTRRIVDDYEARMADLRARADRLRQQLAQSSGSGAGAAQLPAARTATGPVAQAAGDPGLPAGLTLEERVVATEQAIQLDALIDWVEAQAAIDVNGGR